MMDKQTYSIKKQYDWRYKEQATKAKAIKLVFVEQGEGF